MTLQLLVPTTFVVAYLAGSLPTGVLVARRHGVDLRKVGSGNVGATNVGRALGRRWAIFVLAVDAAKGALPVLLARGLATAGLLGSGGGPEDGATSTAPAAATAWLAAIAGLGAVLGHVFSVFLRGRGGKGVATALGAALALAPAAALGALALYLILYLPTRISSLGSLAGALGFPALLWLLGDLHPARLGFALGAALVIALRHRDNLRRLARGTELRG